MYYYLSFIGDNNLLLNNNYRQKMLTIAPSRAIILL